MASSVKGLTSLIGKLDALKKAAEAEAAKGLYLSGLKIEEYAKKSLAEGGKTGRVYKRGKRGRVHVASAPGEAPATDTGRLVNSVGTKALGNGRVVQVKAGGSSSVGYAADLEFGTDKMAPRPFMRPALKKATPEIEKVMGKSLKEATTKVTKR